MNERIDSVKERQTEMMQEVQSVAKGVNAPTTNGSTAMATAESQVIADGDVSAQIGAVIRMQQQVQHQQQVLAGTVDTLQRQLELLVTTASEKPRRKHHRNGSTASKSAPGREFTPAAHGTRDHQGHGHAGSMAA